MLLIEDDPLLSDELATQLVRLGVEPIRVPGLAEAIETVKSKEYMICGVLIPSDLTSAELLKAMKKMRRHQPLLRAMVYGKAVDAAHRKLLRKADVPFALWYGFDEGMLRFQVNRLIYGDGKNPTRESLRAPVHTPIRMLIGGREKLGVLYSVSEGGCFIETARACTQGAQLFLSFRLGEIAYDIGGTVAFSNVPGNLQRPNLPLGMGVGFDELTDKTVTRLAHFVHERLQSLEV